MHIPYATIWQTIAVANWTFMYNDQLKYLSSSSLIYSYSSKLLQNMF